MMRGRRQRLVWILSVLLKTSDEVHSLLVHHHSLLGSSSSSQKNPHVAKASLCSRVAPRLATAPGGGGAGKQSTPRKQELPSLTDALSDWLTKGTQGRLEPASTSEMFDLVVFGAGPVGVRSAMRGAELGARVLVVDGSPTSELSFGGPTGLFSKALRDTSKRVAVTAYRGLGMDDESIWTQIRNECGRLAATNARAMRRELITSGATVARGEGALTSTVRGSATSTASFPKKTTGGVPPHVEVSVTEKPPSSSSSSSSQRGLKTQVRKYRAKFALLASGSRPFRPDGVPFDGKRIFDSDSINGLSYLPRSIAITGSGIVAIEYAKIFNNLGSDVTLIFRDDSPKFALAKSGVDKDLAAVLVSDLRRSGVSFASGSVCSKFDVPKAASSSPSGAALASSSSSGKRLPVKITLEPSGKSPSVTEARDIKVDAYLAAVGRRPRTEELGLDRAGVQVDDYGGIVVDADLRTSNPLVYAAGDVVGRPFLASTGVAQGLSAVDRICRRLHLVGAKNNDDASSSSDDEHDETTASSSSSSSFGAAFDPASIANDPFAFPVGIWSSPEVAWYGLTLAQAKARGVEATEGIALFKECLRGIVFSPDGLLKLVVDEKDQTIIGVHIVGTDACEIIHFGMELVRAKRTLQDVVQATYSAVTFTELYQVAARACLDPEAARLRRRAAGAAWAAAQQELRAEADAWAA